MANATVTIDRLEPLQICGKLASKITLNHPLMLRDNVENLVQIFFGQILSTDVRIDTGFLDDLVGTERSDAINIAKGVTNFLFGRDFNAEKTRHDKLSLAVENEYLGK